MSATPEQPPGFDLDAHAWDGRTYRELIEFLSGVGAKLTFFWNDSEIDLREVLSPASFVRLLCERGGHSLFIAGSAKALARNLPFLPYAEVCALSQRFACERVHVPTPYNIVRHYRKMMIVELFMKGEPCRAIARQVRCSDRYVRYITQGLKRDVPHG